MRTRNRMGFTRRKAIQQGLTFIEAIDLADSKARSTGQAHVARIAPRPLLGRRPTGPHAYAVFLGQAAKLSSKAYNAQPEALYFTGQ